jgi:hypothetical protein
MSSDVGTLFRLPFSTSEHRKLGKLYEGETNVCKFLFVIINITVMWIVGRLEFIYAEDKPYIHICARTCVCVCVSLAEK